MYHVPMEGLNKAISLAGSPSKLASLPGISKQRVSNWRAAGVVPPDSVLAVVRALDGQVTPFELREDLYPDPAWLPPGISQASSARQEARDAA